MWKQQANKQTSFKQTNNKATKKQIIEKQTNIKQINDQSLHIIAQEVVVKWIFLEDKQHDRLAKQANKQTLYTNVNNKLKIKQVPNKQTNSAQRNEQFLHMII